MQRCLTSLITRKMQMKTAVGYRLTLVTMAMTQKIKTASVGEEYTKGTPCALLVGMSSVTATVENSMEIPQKTKNRTTV